MDCTRHLNGTLFCPENVTDLSPSLHLLTPTTTTTLTHLTPILHTFLDLATSFLPSSSSSPTTSDLLLSPTTLSTTFHNLSHTTLFNNNSSNSSNNNRTMMRGIGRRRPRGVSLGMQIQLPIYVVIFLLSVVGNVLVMVTLLQNKKMRTVTNVFLLNLAVSDLLLAVFCMPFTIIPLLLKNFVFGEVMCVLIRYVQGVSVSVSCFTLVAISLERYFAICRPLHSRSWQTLSHAYRSIAVCWVLAAVLMVPLAVFHQLKQVGPRTFMCVEIWQDQGWEQAYTMLINLMLLVLPVLLMTLAYSCVSYTLWIGIKLEARSEAECQRKSDSRGGAAAGGGGGRGGGLGGGGGGGDGSSVVYNHHNNGVSLTADPSRRQTAATTPTSPTTTINISTSSSSSHHDHSHQATSVSRPFRRFDAHRAMRQSNSEKSRAAKKRVIKMLFMIVIEFFVFWTPVYVIGTWIIFDRASAIRTISPVVKSLFHLLSYVSACCNPITYCFMNKNFRKGFLAAFRCCKKRHVYASRRREFSFSGHTLSTRGTVMSQTMATTSYDKIRDSDDVSEKSF